MAADYICLNCYDGKGYGNGEYILANATININKSDEVVAEDGPLWCGECNEENIIPIADKHLYPELNS